MASDPSEETVANFVSFTSTTREQAISFLKVRTAFPKSSTAKLISSRQMEMTLRKRSTPTSKTRRDRRQR